MTEITTQEVIDTPIGNLAVSLSGNTLVGLEFTTKKAIATTKLSDACKAVVKDLQTYFDSPTHQFKTKLSLSGTPFQEKVWKALLKIPAGKKITYGELAEKLQTSPRAIGNACRENPIMLIVPCHRVVGKKGLVGYAGATGGSNIKTKAFLLEHEQR